MMAPITVVMHGCLSLCNSLSHHHNKKMNVGQSHLDSSVISSTKSLYIARTSAPRDLPPITRHAPLPTLRHRIPAQGLMLADARPPESDLVGSGACVRSIEVNRGACVRSMEVNRRAGASIVPGAPAPASAEGRRPKGWPPPSMPARSSDAMPSDAICRLCSPAYVAWPRAGITRLTATSVPRYCARRTMPKVPRPRTTGGSSYLSSCGKISHSASFLRCCWCTYQQAPTARSANKAAAPTTEPAITPDRPTEAIATVGTVDSTATDWRFPAGRPY